MGYIEYENYIWDFHIGFCNCLGRIILGLKQGCSNYYMQGEVRQLLEIHQYKEQREVLLLPRPKSMGEIINFVSSNLNIDNEYGYRNYDANNNLFRHPPPIAHTAQSRL